MPGKIKHVDLGAMLRYGYAMDSLTHGLLGLAVGALRRAEGPVTQDGPRTSVTDRAVLLACVVAAELPDLDYFWPAGDPVLQTLRAHRGPSHAIVFAPLVALVALGLSRIVFRGARSAPIFAWSLLSVLVAHLLPDLWTGWGTRLFLPFSEARLTLDWTGVVDPFVTVPLVVGSLVALRRRAIWRRAILVGLAVAAAWVGGRIATRRVLLERVAAVHPQALDVHVFPDVLGVVAWRYVATYPDAHSAGRVRLFDGAPVEDRRVPLRPDGPLPAKLAAVPTIREALEWARFPVVRHELRADGSGAVRVADLRYHLRGSPTLEFVLDVDAAGTLVRAELQRGGTARELLERWRAEGAEIR